MPFSTSDLHGAYRRDRDLLRVCGRRRLDGASRRCSPFTVVRRRGRGRPHARRTHPGCRGTADDERRRRRLRPTAALLHGCTALSPAETHVLLPYGRSPRERPGLVVHHSCFFQDQVQVLDGLRVLALPQVVADLLCTARPADALAVGDETLRMAGPRCDEFRKRRRCRIRARPDHGARPGPHLWELARLAPSPPPESWTRLLLIEQGFPLPEVNFSILSPVGRELYRLDLAWPQLRIAVEYDGHAVQPGRRSTTRAGGGSAASRVDRRPRPGRRPRRTLPRFAELRAAFARRGYTW